MATERKELRTDLRITGENAVKQGLKGVGAEAKKTGAEMADMARDAELLNQRIVELGDSTKDLVREFARTGDLRVRKQIRQELRQARELQRFAKLLPTPDGGGVPTPVGAGLVGKPALMGIGALLAADIAPFLGGVIASAVIGGVGIGGIAGGIALAAQDGRVRNAASELAGQLGPAFTASADPIIAPVVDALDILRREGGSVAADLKTGFASVAPSIVPLAEGLSGLVHEMMPGLLKTFEASKPVLRTIGAELPRIGGAVSDFLSDVSDDPDGAVLAFKALSEIIQGTVRGAGKLISTLSETYEWSIRTAQSASAAGEEFFSWIPGVGFLAEMALGKANDNLTEALRALEEANRSTGDLGQSSTKLTVVQYGLGVALDGSTEAIEAQRLAMRQLVDLQLDSLGGTIAVERALDSFTEAVRENGKSLDVREESGRRNLETIRGGVQAVLDAAEAERNLALANGATAREAEEAAKTYRDKYGKALEEAARKAYGNSAELQKILDLLKQLDGKRITYTIVQRGGVTIGAKVPGGFIPSGFEERAAGGPVQPHRLYRVNEAGVEFLQTGSQAGHILNAGQTAAMISGASGGSSAPMRAAGVQSTGDPGMDALIDLLWPHIQKRYRINGGFE